MADLLKSNIGDPSVPLATKTPAAKVDKTAAVFSQLTALGAAGIQMYQKEHEVNMTRQAMNDVVNNTVNADIKHHEAAYATTVAKGEAIKGYNALNEEIKYRKYNDVEPEEFQKSLNERHKEYKSSISKNTYSKAESAEYDKFWFQNEATITAGQAGKYRTDLGTKQMSSLNEQLSSLVTASVVPTADDIIDIASSPGLTLIDEDNRITSMLIAGIELARQNPEEGIKVLQDLNTELSFSTDPQRHVAYTASVKKARKDIVNNENSTTAQHAYNVVASVDELAKNGDLTDAHYFLVKDTLGPNKKPIYTQKQFKAKVNESAKKFAKLYVINNGISDIKAGINTNLKPKEFTSGMDQLYIQELAASGNDPIVALENMGRYAADQTSVWSPLKDRMVMFNRELLLTRKGEVNKDAMQRYQEIAAVERGLGFNNRGKKVFASYMGESLPQYEAIKEALTFTKDSEEGAWTSVAEYLNLREEAAKKRKWDIGLDRVSNLVAKAFDEHMQDGYSVAVSKVYAERKGHAQVHKWGGELYDTWGQKPAFIFGTSDPDGAYNSMIQDPQWNAMLKEKFGITLGEIIFGIDDPEVTEDDIREQEQDRADAHLILQKKNIVKDINLDTGTLDLRSSIGGGSVMSIPLLDIGAAHEARLQNTEEIDRLERLYDTEFQSTEAGKQWAAEQEILNDTFLNDVLMTDKSYRRTDTTSTEYVDMSEIDQTRNRLQFHKDNYSGILGKIGQLADFFNLKREVGSKPVYVPLLDASIESLPTTFMEAIHKGESFGGDYDAYRSKGSGVAGKDSKLDTNITSMTIGDIMKEQASGNLDAVGSMQVIPKTLKSWYKKAGLKTTDKFTKKNQDKLTLALATQKRKRLGRWLRGEKTATQAQAAKELAQEWASFPVIRNMKGHYRNVKVGESYYAKEGGINKANHTVKETKDLLNEMKGKLK